MRIPRTEEITLLFLSDLADHYPDELVSLTDIAARHGVSVLFLKKLARQLKLAHLVRSKEGIGGGYSLVRQPKTISLWEVIQAVDTHGENKPQGGGVCPLHTRCVPQRIHQRLNDALKDKFTQISLSEIVK